MRRLLLSLLAALLLAGIAMPASAATNYQWFVYGRSVSTETPLVEEDGRLWLPLRELSEALGYSVEYDSDTQMITVFRPLAARRFLYLQVGSDQVRDADQAYRMDAPVLLRDEQAFVPLTFVTGILWLTVEWDGASKVVKVDWLTDEQLPERVQNATVRLCTLRVMNCGYYHLAG